MIPEPQRLKLPPQKVLRRLREAERRFHRRAFGEELARVNLDFSPEERRAYLEWMRTFARRNGVPRQLNYSVAWMVKLEEELNRELGE
ncbi:MAG: hypothetical protein HYY24_30165 [Verrucomicrobia bacterium]|nr:hypothetical protein [Verrucomicrobiota bacterium]